jgi:hypothetical protein
MVVENNYELVCHLLGTFFRAVCRSLVVIMPACRKACPQFKFIKSSKSHRLR